MPQNIEDIWYVGNRNDWDREMFYVVDRGADFGQKAQFLTPINFI
jgi:hypothetical protein